DSPQTITTYDAHSGGVHAAVSVSSGTSAEMMVSVGSDHKAHVWDLDQGLPQRRSATGHHGRVRSAAFLTTPGPEDGLLITPSNPLPKCAEGRIMGDRGGKSKAAGAFRSPYGRGAPPRSAAMARAGDPRRRHRGR